MNTDVVAATRAGTKLGALLVALGLAASVSACGSSGSSTTASNSGSSGASSTASGDPGSTGTGTSAIPYDGPEKQYIGAVPGATEKPGYKFTIGFLQPAGFIPTLVVDQQAAEAETKALGGQFIALDANDSVQTQVSQFNDLIAKKVSAIISFPLDPSAEGPSLKAAEQAGIPVIEQEAPAEVTQPRVPSTVTQVTQGWDQSSYLTMKAIATLEPGVTFGVIDTSSPIPALHYQAETETAWGEKFGLKFTGKVFATADTPSAWAAAAESLITKYPTTKVILAYNDPVALSGISALRSGGHTDVKLATTNGYSTGAKAEIESGAMIADYTVPWNAIGKATTDIVYEVLTKQKPATSFAVAYIPPGVVATKATLDEPAVTSETVK